MQPRSRDRCCGASIAWRWSRAGDARSAHRSGQPARIRACARGRARTVGSAWPSLALVIVDLDDFKLVNDRHGHGVGDEALVMLAERLRDSVRSADTVARLGGEEFALLLPETPLSGALAVAERARTRSPRAGCDSRVAGDHGDGELRRSGFPGIARPDDPHARRRPGALYRQAARQESGSSR